LSAFVSLTVLTCFSIVLNYFKFMSHDLPSGPDKIQNSDDSLRLDTYVYMYIIFYLVIGSSKYQSLEIKSIILKVKLMKLKGIKKLEFIDRKLMEYLCVNFVVFECLSKIYKAL
jgi:hypothetical protein